MSGLSLALSGATKVPVKGEGGDNELSSSPRNHQQLPIRGLDSNGSSRVVDVPETTTDSLSGSSPLLSSPVQHNLQSQQYPLAASPPGNSGRQPFVSSSLRNSSSRTVGSPLARGSAGLTSPLSTSASSSVVGSQPIPGTRSAAGFAANGGHHRTSSASRRRLSSSSLTPSGSYIAKSSPLSIGSSLKNSTAIDDLDTSSSPNGPLNTNSPIALAAAAAVTPDKLSRLLLTQGPLAIRHITSHLALTITGFADLSLSKQRRLIIAALDSGDTVNNVVFEKVGWGRWTARKLDGGANGKTTSASLAALSATKRRESMTANLSYEGRPPVSPVLRATDSPHFLQSRGGAAWAVDDVDLADDDMMFHNSPRKARGSSSAAVFDDDDEDDDEYEEDDYDLVNQEQLHGSMVERHDPHPHSTTRTSHHRTNSTTSNGRHHHLGDTDDEDWQGMGAASLRKTMPNGEIKEIKIEGISRAKELDAVDALVQLRSI